MKEVVIVDAVRTPTGNHGGMLKDFDATALAQMVIKGLLERTKIDPQMIAEVILGNVFQSSDAPNIARVAALKAGIPNEVPAFNVARNCDSIWCGVHAGLEGAAFAIYRCAAGRADRCELRSADGAHSGKPGGGIQGHPSTAG